MRGTFTTGFACSILQAATLVFGVISVALRSAESKTPRKKETPVAPSVHVQETDSNVSEQYRPKAKRFVRSEEYKCWVQTEVIEHLSEHVRVGRKQ